jgi:hypothetical protein
MGDEELTQADIEYLLTDAEGQKILDQAVDEFLDE